MKAVKLLCVLAVFLSGCESSKFGAQQVFDQPIDKVDVIALLSKGNSSSENLEGAAFSKAFDQALRQFKPADKLERNRIQDRIILASNQSCEIYKIHLKEKQSRSNFWFGVAATTFGAAGAVVDGAEAGHTLAGLSGTASGIRAEYNQSYFSDLAAQVITKGINARRSKILEAIDAAKNQELAGYTVEMAIADAISYHGACSLVGGLEQADSAVSKVNNEVGIDALGANPYFKKLLTTPASTPATTNQ